MDVPTPITSNCPSPNTRSWVSTHTPSNSLVSAQYTNSLTTEEAKTLWLLTHPNEPTPSFAIGYRTPIDRSGQTTISANVLYFSDEPPREGILVVGLLRSTIAESLRVLKVCVCSRRKIAGDAKRVGEEGKGREGEGWSEGASG